MINQFKEYERNEMQNRSRIRNKKENIYTKGMKKIDLKKSYIVIFSEVMLSLCICILYFFRYKQFDLY